MLALTNYGSSSERELIDPMVNLDGTATLLNSDKITVLDISRVEGDLQQIRKSIEHASAYEVSWTGSGLPKLGEWLSQSTLTATDGTSKTLITMLDSILGAASASAERQMAAALIEEQSGIVNSDTRAELDEAIDAFLADAHLELQTGMAKAFESESWRKLAWWKLFWRVDDVPLIVTDLAQRYWLKESSLVVFEVLGRLHQAGLIEFVSYDGRIIEFATTDGEELPPSLRPTRKSASTTDYLEDPDQPVLKSSELSRTRQSFLLANIPNMTATAQSSLFKSISFSATSAALSALAYVSTLTPSAYECGAILALGGVFALRRLQKQWEACRDQFKKDIFDAGRSALKSTEEFMKFAVREGGRKKVDQVDLQIREEASSAIAKAKKALDQIR